MSAGEITLRPTSDFATNGRVRGTLVAYDEDDKPTGWEQSGNWSDHSFCKKAARSMAETLDMTYERAFSIILRFVKVARSDEGGATHEVEEKPKSQATRLVSLALNSGVDLWHTPTGDPYATIRRGVNDHEETFLLKGRNAAWWLRYMYHLATDGESPGGQAIGDAIGALQGLAIFEGREREVFVRVGTLDSKTYIDLANDEWEALEIDASGWRVIKRAPVRFRRPRGMLALPTPARGGDISELRSFIKVEDEDMRLLVAWLVAALYHKGPYPLLELVGPPGAAKSTMGRLMRLLVDPNTVPLRGDPKNARDLAISAHNAHVMAFDNLSGIPQWLNDAFCRLSTGGGFATRELFTDDEEALFDGLRPLILTGIDDLAVHSDLTDRAIPITLQRIPDEERLEEAEFWPRFHEAAPRILGALLDGLVLSIAVPQTLTSKPRMADFARLAASASPSFGWSPHQFLDTYAERRKDANSTVLESSPLAGAVLTFARAHEQEVGWKTNLYSHWTWEGAASYLYDLLHKLVTDEARRSAEWPKAPNALTNKLRRILPNLAAEGLTLVLARTNKGSTVMFEATEKLMAETPSPSSPDGHAADGYQAQGGDGRGDGGDGGDGLKSDGDGLMTMFDYGDRHRFQQSTAMSGGQSDDSDDVSALNRVSVGSPCGKANHENFLRYGDGDEPYCVLCSPRPEDIER